MIFVVAIMLCSITDVNPFVTWICPMSTEAVAVRTDSHAYFLRTLWNPCQHTEQPLSNLNTVAGTTTPWWRRMLWAKIGKQPKLSTWLTICLLTYRPPFLLCAHSIFLYKTTCKDKMHMRKKKPRIGYYSKWTYVFNLQRRWSHGDWLREYLSAIFWNASTLIMD